MVPLKVHNVLDYIIAAVLLVAPWLFGFSDIPAARNFFLFAGIALGVYSAMTNYYYSLVKAIPLGVHMAMDVITGVAVILAPALFGYRDLITGAQNALHVVLGLGAVGLVALTRPRTEAAKTPAERAGIAHDYPLTH